MELTIGTYLNTLRLKGYLAYEYNPFHNYLTNVDLQETVEGFLIPKNGAVDIRNGKILTKNNGDPNSVWKDENGINPDDKYIRTYEGDTADITKDSLIDLDTQQLSFDINHPVDIEILPSYDGSVNLIFNDNKNIPRLINSRFSVREKNTYEIVDRIGENDTNIYSSNSFDKDTSLYFLYKSNPKIKLKNLISGILPVGLYCFYFTYCDSDDNESDFIGESGLIPIFIGVNGDPASMDGGIKNLNSNKGIKLQLSNLDSSYNYLKVYYVRYFADYLLNRVYECKKIYNKYFINSNKLTLQITGNEETEDLDPNILNMIKFNAKSILTLALCKNMLFFGNIVKNFDDYRELLDCALRIIPECVNDDLFEGGNYSDAKYYNIYNMYSKVGYFNNEYYRFGIVFIYENGTLSNVYNTLGYDTNEEVTYSTGTLFSNEIRKYIKIDDEGWIINDNEFNTKVRLNSRGVCKIKSSDTDKIIGIKFKIPNEVKEHLLNMKIRGLFFVRQKRVPNILALCYILPMDTLLLAPILKIGEEYITESFVTLEKSENYNINTIPGNNSTTTTIKKVTLEGRELDNMYSKRLFKYGNTLSLGKNSYVAICPDFLLNLPYYNQIFNGAKFKLQQVTTDSNLEKTDINRFYKEKNSRNMDFSSRINGVATICTVTEEVSTIALGKTTFKLEIGKAEEAYRFNYAQIDNGSYSSGDSDFDKINNATNIVRGKYSPYLAIQGANLEECQLYNIYPESYLDSNQQYLNRMNSSEPFYAISDRYNWDELDKKSEDNNKINYFLDCFRGDCYQNLFTYRLNRNFNDSSLPNNDRIIDKNTWKDHYRADNLEEFKNISRSDVNAVLLGSWITIEVKSSYNYALRSEDYSYVSEAALMGSPRSFYPRKLSMWLGNYKMPDSYLYNDAYRATLGYKCYFTLQDTNYIKNTFSNRIQYSAMAIQDSFKNNYRESYSTYFRDYSIEYGSIQKLVGFEGYLLVIFEHAIGVAVINERVLAAQGDGEPVFINTGNVLPEELTIITDTYGTLWPESVIKSEAGYVYGVDTIAKKIWRVKGKELEILSDFKVNKFLNENISLGERELYPIIGVKNIKTHYNNNKKDIIFTFYDDIYKDEEKVWSLCYNELLGQFITFYSWIPSYSENIDTQFFTFDRNTSKVLSMLDVNNYANSNNTGIVLNGPILDYNLNNNKYFTEIHYRDPSSKEIIDSNKINFELLKDHWGYYKYFKLDSNLLYIEETDRDNTKAKNIKKLMKDNNLKVIILYIKPIITNSYSLKNGSSIILSKSLQVVLTFEDFLYKNPENSNIDKELPLLKTDFYLHGRSGIYDVKENLYPSYWYGEFHPFEFEFIVNDKIGQLKIFTNLEIISNKAEPESFHFEIEGDNYEFSSDKRTMYFRLEATKNLFLNLGSDMLYNRHYTDIVADKYTYEQYYRGNPIRRDGENLNTSEYTDNYSKLDKVYPLDSQGLVRQVKSTIFPLYYEKIDTYNDIYHKYNLMKSDDGMYDFLNLSGSEISWDRDLNLFNIITHIKNSPINLVGRLRGNSYYKEGKWSVLIPSINFMLKNESDWITYNSQTNSSVFILGISRLDEDYLGYESGFIIGSGEIGKNCLGPGSSSETNLLDNIKDGFKLPPIVINSTYIPKDLSTTYIDRNSLPNIYKGGEYISKTIDTSNWTYRKETKIRDKWMKVRVRYSGKNLAVIHSLITLYNISYS